jgi:putative transposase
MVFEKFSLKRLEDLLTRHPLSPQGRKFLDNALAAPSRNVQGTRHNVVSDLPCPKMWANAQAESWSAENPFTLEHIFNSNVIGYTNQVPPIEVHYKGRNGRTIRSRYTGDCLCFESNLGIILEEWKPASDRGLLEEKFPGKYQQLESGEYTSAPIYEVLNPWGIQFVVRFSDEISPIATRNRRFLYPYLQPSASQSYISRLPTLLSMLTDIQFRSYSDLIDSGIDPDTLNWAIATGHVHIDFDSALLSTESSAVLVFRHLETLEAWQLAVRPDGSRPTSTVQSPSERLRPGDVFLFDGKRLTVSMEGATAIYAVDDSRQHVTIGLELLANALREGKVVLPTPATRDMVASRFVSASPASLQRAIKKIQILEQLDKGETVAIEDQYSASTQRRWRRAIQNGEAQGMSPVESLLDFVDQRGFCGTHIDPQFSETLNKWIETAIADNKNVSANSIFYDLKARAEEIGYKMIAISSYYERVAKIRSLKTIRASQGFKTAYQLEPSYWMLDQNTPVHCERALELVHLDSTLLDIELRSSLSGEVIGRPWLTLAICAASRRIVGIHLSFKPPSYLSTMMVLADIVQRFGRLPDAVIHDWGSEFKAKDWKYALTALFISRHVRPKSSPRFGSVIERFFGITMREFIDNVAGNTKIRKNVRQITPQSDSSTHSGLYLSDLYQGLENYFFNLYDNRKHPVTLQSPRAFFEASLISHGVRPHRLKRYEDLLPILMPTAKGRPRSIDPARGIFVNYRFYGHPLLADLSLKGWNAAVKPIPFDPGRVLVFLRGNWVVCKSKLNDEFSHAPDFVRRCLYEEWLIEQRLVRSSHVDSRMKLRELLNELNQKALDNKEYWRSRELHELVSVSDFSLPTSGPVESHALDRLNDLMGSALANAMCSASVGKLVEDN